MSLPLISVIIPVHKVEHYLHNCVNSVLSQSYSNWEMILIDDGSPDRCGEICDEYAAKDSRIKVIHKENGGLSSALNAGLDYPPKGEFVTFLDSDDFWHPEYLEALMNLQQKYHADLVQCGFVRGSESVFPPIEGSISIDVLDNHEVFIKEKANVIMCGKLYRTSLFDGIIVTVLLNCNKEKNMLQNKNMAIFYVMLPFLTLFTPLIRSNGTMIRIALYYSIFMTLLVPYGIECMANKRNRQYIFMVTICALSFLALLGGGMTYYFFWQI